MNGPTSILLGKILHNCFPGSQVLDIIPFGASSWSHTAHIEVRQQDGSEKDYFVKWMAGDRDMKMKREFHSMLQLHAASPIIIPKPHAGGTAQLNGSTTQWKHNSMEAQLNGSTTQWKHNSMEAQLNGSTTQWKHNSMEAQLNGSTREKKERERSGDERKDAAATSYLSAYEDLSCVSYIVFDFVHAADQPPEPASLCDHLVQIHRTRPASQSFGFHGLVPTIQGIPTTSSADPNWPRFFSNLIHFLFQKDLELNGCWHVYEQAFDNVVHRVIPRLLGCLQSPGLRPSLVHGNLSDGNIAVDAATGMPVVFSACAMYAHHEYELGTSRVPAWGLDEAYLDTYVRYIKPSHPRGEFRDRVILYGIKFNLDSSVSGRNPAARERILQDMQYLNARYASRQ